tara:strand:+ start:63624 stop:63839 length:216 start_codon:yes stop_codon:yes gene_type:complete
LSIQEETERKCSFCGAVEGKPRPLGRYIVELTPVNGKLACQSCRVHHNDDLPKRDLKKSFWEKLKKKFGED